MVGFSDIVFFFSGDDLFSVLICTSDLVTLASACVICYNEKDSVY